MLRYRARAIFPALCLMPVAHTQELQFFRQGVESRPKEFEFPYDVEAWTAV